MITIPVWVFIVALVLILAAVVGVWALSLIHI